MQTRNIYLNNLLNKDLQSLEDIFSKSGYELVFVGGCVRDSLIGKSPKDIDLATSATPEEQIALYRAHGLRYFETGIDHGTITVVMRGEPYEITTYRLDQETDGRHAVVSYTRDLIQDLARRDLTINAMALRFDGTLIDPFGGIDDLMVGNIRFVGDAQERIKEDYLRILRFFRFFGRFGSDAPEPAAMKAIKSNAQDLRQISVERIWMEMSKIIGGPQASLVVSYMREVGVLEAIGMPEGAVGSLSVAQSKGVTDPASIMGWFVSDPASVNQIANAWKWSSEERKRANFIADAVRQARRQTPMDFFKRRLVDGKPLEWIVDAAHLSNLDPQDLQDWEVPVMPVSGNDLMDWGMKPGPELGKMLYVLREKWIESNYSLDKDSLRNYV